MEGASRGRRCPLPRISRSCAQDRQGSRLVWRLLSRWPRRRDGFSSGWMRPGTKHRTPRLRLTIHISATPRLPDLGPASGSPGHWPLQKVSPHWGAARGSRRSPNLALSACRSRAAGQYTYRHVLHADLTTAVPLGLSRLGVAGGGPLGEVGIDQRTADVGDVQHAGQAGVAGDWQVGR